MAVIYLGYAILIVVLIGVMAWAKGDGIDSPLGMTVVLWLVVFLAGLLVHKEFYVFDDKNLELWLCWFLVSCTGYLVCSGSNGQRNPPAFRELPLDYSILIFALILLLIHKTWQIGNSGPTGFLLNLRLAATDASEDVQTLGWVGRFYPVVFALFIFESLYAAPQNRRPRVLLWTWMLLFAVATMGKFAILTPVWAWIVMKKVKGELKSAKLALVAGITLILMLVLHFSRASDDDKSTLVGVLSAYIYAPIVAVGQLAPTRLNHDFGEYTFRIFYAVKHSVMGGSEPAKTILGYVGVPTPINVYTVVQPFYQDFGLSGIVCGAALYGFVFGGLFSFARRGKGLPLMLYAGLSISIISQALGETFVLNASGNLQFAFASVLIFYFSRRQTCQSTS